MPDLFGAKLRFLRLQHGLSQLELAGKLDLAQQSYVSHLETGKKEPSLELVVRIARVFQASTDYLLRDTVSMEQTDVAHHIQSPVQTATFGQKLERLRRDATLTQTELAHKLLLAQPGYISNLEKGRKFPSPTLIVRIADLFGVTTDWLLEGSFG